MTIEEAKMTIYANCIYACEKAGFDLSTICVVDDALRTVIAMADRKTENSSEKPNNSTISKMEQVEDEPQEYPCEFCRNSGSQKCEDCKDFGSNYEPKDEPQTDCAWR